MKKKRLHKYITALFLSCLLPVPGLFAAGTKGADFLTIAVGARPAGLGEAFVGVADETDGMFYNPAGPGFSLSPEMQTMYGLLPGGLSYGFLGYSQPTLSGTYGVALQYLTAPTTPRISEGVRTGDFGYSDGAANLHYSFRMSENTCAGLNLRGLRSRIADSEESALTGDCGLLYRTPDEHFSFGVAGQNLVGKLGKDELPSAFRAGLSYKANFPEQFSSLLFTVEGGRVAGESPYYAAGIEHWGAGILGLRAGYKYLTDDRQRAALDPLAAWRAGLSVRVGSLALDYAYQPFSVLGEAHRISLTWRVFGWKKLWRSVAARVKADPVIFSPNVDGAKDSVFFVPQVPDIRTVTSWELQVQDLGHKVIKRITGRDVLPKIISWDGQTESGEYVPEGKYLYSLIVEGDGNKRAVSSGGELTVDLTVPAASLQVSGDTLVPGRDGLACATTFYISVCDANGIDQWQLAVVNAKGKNVKVFKSTESVPVELSWNGKDDYYEAFVPGGEYEARLTAWDAAGNKAQTSLKLAVNMPVRCEPGETAAEPVKEIKMKEDDRGLVVSLPSQLLFAAGQSGLRPEASRSLDGIISVLQSRGDDEVLIEGYTDTTGDREANIALSDERAWSLYGYLVKHGIAPVRLKPKGYGPDDPVAANTTAAGRALNRRMEIIIRAREQKQR